MLGDIFRRALTVKSKIESDLKTVKIASWLDSRSMSQIYLSGLEYAFIADDKRQATHFAYCKDFLSDALWASVNDSAASIFGFTYDSKTMPPISFDKTRIALVNKSDPDFLKKAENSEDFTNQLCKRLKLKPTKFYRISNPPWKYSNGALYLSGSGIWQNSPPLISMYSLLLRVGFAHTKGDDCLKTINGVIKGSIKPYGKNDADHLTRAKRGIDRILKFGYRKFFYIDNRKNYPSRSTVGAIHGSGGICAFSNNSSQLVPYWNRKSLIKIEEI